MSDQAANAHVTDLPGGAPVSVRHSPRARRYRITVGADGVTLTVPRRGSLAGAAAFLESRRDWVAGRLADWSQRLHQTLPPGHLRLAGRLRPVQLEPSAGRHGLVHDTGSEILVRVPGGCRRLAEQALERWLRRLAARRLSAEVDRQAIAMGVRPVRLSLRGQVSRWGSCSTRGTLSFNWRIVLEDPALLAYLVTHELAHLIEHNHGPAFWALVARHCPGHRALGVALDRDALSLRGPWIRWPG